MKLVLAILAIAGLWVLAVLLLPIAVATLSVVGVIFALVVLTCFHAGRVFLLMLFFASICVLVLT